MYYKEWIQILPITLEQAWSYFSRPENLKEITPADLSLTLISDLNNVEMYEGMMINYSVRPLFNIPLNWTTEITHIKQKEYFIDEQKIGPYKIWHHEHHFLAVPEGVCMTDKLYYDLSLGPFNNMANKYIVSKKIDAIFEFRNLVLKSKF